MSIQQFKDLHLAGQPLLLANVWDAHSAQIAEKAGCKAVGTSSHAISNALGKEDGNNLAFDELLFFIERIVPAVNIPVSVDIESGYADNPEDIANNIIKLAQMGVVGINIEDSITEDGNRTLVDAETFANTLQSVKQILQQNNTNIFINLRTDTYVTKHSDALEETIRRGTMYKKAGADGLFVPLITNSEEIAAVISQVGLPLNVFATADGPSYEAFKDAGVHRISSGDAAYALLTKHLTDAYTSFNNKDLSALFTK